MSGGDDGGVDLWRVGFEDKGKLIHVTHEENAVSHSNLVTSVACRKSRSSSNECLFASSSLDCTAVLWGAGNGGIEFRACFVPQCKSPINQVCWSDSDRGRIVTASDDGVVRLWSESKFMPWLHLNAGSPSLCALWLGESYVAVGTEIGSLILFDTRKPEMELKKVEYVAT